jgi:hypothetical protein
MQPFKYIAGTDDYNKMLPTVTLQASMRFYEVCQSSSIQLSQHIFIVYKCL